MQWHSSFNSTLGIKYNSMCASWQKGYVPDQLTRLLEGSKETDTAGKVSFHGFGFGEYVTVLNSMVSLNKAIPKVAKRRIIDKAALAAGQKGKITATTLLSEINDLEKQYLKEKPHEYVLVTSLSVSRSCKLKRININGCTISFHPVLPRHVIDGIEKKILRQASYSVLGELPKSYIYVKIKSIGKSHYEAVDKAIESLDITRGIWNLFFNRGQHIRRSYGGRRAPVNKIVIGPLHTLHHPSGHLATEAWWYEPSYHGPIGEYDLTKKLDDLYRFENNVKRYLKKCRYRSFMETALMKYARALDMHDWDSSFIRLWSLLESLTNTCDNETHKVTVRRASSLFREREYARQVLNHLRSYRNEAIHVEAGNPDIETLMYQLKHFVEVAIEFLLANKMSFQNLNEASQFFDLVDESLNLKRKAKMINYALKLTK